jgi:hypothetical protein
VLWCVDGIAVGSLTASTFYSNRYDDGMDSAKKEKELWDRLANEPERAYRAFESFRSLAGGERPILAAYRSYVGNLRGSLVKPTSGS